MRRLSKRLQKPRSSPSKAAGSQSDFWGGFLLTTAGAAVLGGLLLLTRLVQVDSLLVASQAIFNVISGVKGIGLGVGQLLLGVLQMLGFAAVACIALLAVLAIASGTVRIGLRLLPQFETIWQLLARSLNALTQLVALPQARSTPSSVTPIARAQRRSAA